MSESKEAESLNETDMDSSLHQQYISPDDTSVEMVRMTSRNSRTNWNPWSGASYDVVVEASRNQKSLSVVNDDDDDDIEREIEEGSSMTRRRFPRWFSRAVLILISLLVAAVLVTISVIPMVRHETTTATTTTVMAINSTTTPTSMLTDENKTCLLGEFWCGTHAEDVPECIPEEWRCDGEFDCTTGLDEHDCEDFPPITSTTAQPLSCAVWQKTFNESCERPSSSAQCEYVPQCQANGSRWASIQCTVDRRTCWCVDQDDGRTVPGTFAGVDVLIEGEIPDCL